MASRPRPRPAHMLGCTRCAYTPNGRQLVTVGSNNTIRLYKTGYDGEPANVDDCPEQNLAVAARNEFFVAGAEDGTVSVYSLTTNSFERFLLRTALPVRDVALSPDGRWCAVASDELTVRVVATDDIGRVRHLRAHQRPAKHVTFDPRGSTVTVTCPDGVMYVYSMINDGDDDDDGEGASDGEDPPLIRKIDGVIGVLDSDAEACVRAAWHPDGRAFVVATPTRDLQVISKYDWERQRVFAGGHEGAVTALAWSPNGALLASAAQDGKILLWETKTQSVVARHECAGVLDLAWHPTNNLLAVTNGEGEVYIWPDVVAPQYAGLLRLPLQPSPFIHEPWAEVSANCASKPPVVVGRAKEAHGMAARGGDESGRGEDVMSGLDDDDSADGADLDAFFDEDDDGFVDDDDGAGYTNGNGKRARDGALYDGQPAAKRKYGHGGGALLIEPRYHQPFQPGATPWRGNRKYLCLNLVGAVWTVDQDAHHTVTVEFYDHALQRDFHFTDTFRYDKACLGTHGTLFSCPPQPAVEDGEDGTPAVVFFRPHETWTQQRLDWHTSLPEGETVVALALSASFVTVVTSADYVRVYTLFGVPYRVYRPRSTPVVSCAAWRDYVWTLGNGPIMAPDGAARLQYTIEDVRRGIACQSDDTVALPRGAIVESFFFSDEGDPCIYDSTGTLLTLLRWRQPGRANWAPLLDTRLLPRLASGRKQESYFPIAVADHKFHCIILKGGDRYPYFPRPLLSEFDLSVPLGGPPASDDDLDGKGHDEGNGTGNGTGNGRETRRLEQAFVLQGVLAAQLADRLADRESYAGKTALARLELDKDKTLLQLLAVECRAGEERGMRALELVRLMHDANGKMVEAASKVADRYGRTVLGDKIREEGERRMQVRMGLAGEDEDEE